MTQLLLAGAAGPSVVEGGFAVDCRDGDGAQLLEDRANRWRQLSDDKRVRRQYLCATRYALRRGIQARCSWLPKSVRHCGSRRLGAGGVKIGRSGSGHPVWLGVNRCGDPRACPVCSAAVASQRRDALLEAFGQARELGWSAMAVALTVRHGIGHEPAKLAQLLSKAYRLCFERAPMRKLLRELGYQGCIRIVETNYSDENGYHPHLHLVLMFDRECDKLDRTVVQAVLFEAWVLAVNDARIRVGLDIGLPDALHGVDVQLLDLARGPEYFVKVGLVAELLGQFTKAGRRETRTMWEVARNMVVNDRHGLELRAAEDERIWQGYVSAMRHFKSFFVATRLRRKLMAPLQLSLELGDPVTELETLHEFTEQEYSTLVRAGPIAFAAVEAIVEEQGSGAAAAILQYVLQLAERFADLDDAAAARAPVPFAVMAPLSRLELEALNDRVYGAGSNLERTASLLASYDPQATFDRLLEAA